MNFLFHTIVFFGNNPVYYNVYQDGQWYFVEVQDNPGDVKDARNFAISISENENTLSENVLSRQEEILKEEIIGWLRLPHSKP